MILKRIPKLPEIQTMKAIAYTQPTLFLNAVNELLSTQEAFNNLPLGITVKFCQTYPEGVEADHDKFRMIVVEDNGKVVAMACQDVPRFLLFYLGEGEHEEKARLISDMIKEQEWEITGVVGERAAAHQLAKAFVGSNYSITAEHLCYELREVIPPRPAPGILKVAGIESKDLIFKWLEEFYDEVIPEEERDMGIPFDLTEERLKNGQVFLWEDEEPVSMAVATRPLPNGICVSYVYTPLEARKKGYASNIVAALSSEMLRRGKTYCALFTDGHNPTSNKIYQDIGYNLIGKTLILNFNL